MSMFKEKEAHFEKIFSRFGDSDEEEDDEEQQIDCDKQASSQQSSNADQNSTIEEIAITESKNTTVITIEDDDCILIDSADEDVQPYTQTKLNDSLNLTSGRPTATTIDVNQDDEDYDFNLKITISGEYKQFQTRYRTSLGVALKDILAHLKSKKKTLIVTSNEGLPLSLDESPYSLKLTPGSILNAIEVAEQNSDKEPEYVDPDVITLKLQDGHLRHRKEYKTNKFEKLVHLKRLFAKEFGIQIENMKLTFDGDIVDDESTPEDLDMDDGCVIDVHISNT